LVGGPGAVARLTFEPSGDGNLTEDDGFSQMSTATGRAIPVALRLCRAGASTEIHPMTPHHAGKGVNGLEDVPIGGFDAVGQTKEII
jgi:hypothetical protein